MKKIILILISIFMLSFSLFFLIIYLNLLTFGYSFFDYVHFISRRLECMMFFIGILILIYCFKRKENKNALLLRLFSKLR